MCFLDFRFLSGYDYFQGSEVPYIFGCIIVIFIPLALACSAYGVVKIMNSRRRKIKTKWEENNNGKAMDKMYVHYRQPLITVLHSH